MPTPEGFISARRVISDYDGYFDYPIDIRSRIAEYLWDGRLKAKCAYMWTVKSKDLSLGIRKDPKTDFAEFAEIPSHYWRRSGLLRHQHVSAWFWAQNILFASANSKHNGITYFKKVCFDEEGLDKLLGIEIQSDRKGVGGRKPDRLIWDRFFLYMIREAHNGAFRSGKYNSPNDLANKAYIELRGHQESVIFPMCQHIWRLVVDPAYPHGPVTGELQFPAPIESS